MNADCVARKLPQEYRSVVDKGHPLKSPLLITDQRDSQGARHRQLRLAESISVGRRNTRLADFTTERSKEVNSTMSRRPKGLFQERCLPEATGGLGQGLLRTCDPFLK